MVRILAKKPSSKRNLSLPAPEVVQMNCIDSTGWPAFLVSTSLHLGCPVHYPRLFKERRQTDLSRMLFWYVSTVFTNSFFNPVPITSYFCINSVLSFPPTTFPVACHTINDVFSCVTIFPGAQKWATTVSSTGIFPAFSITRANLLLRDNIVKNTFALSMPYYRDLCLL